MRKALFCLACLTLLLSGCGMQQRIEQALQSPSPSLTVDEASPTVDEASPTVGEISPIAAAMPEPSPMPTSEPPPTPAPTPVDMADCPVEIREAALRISRDGDLEMTADIVNTSARTVTGIKLLLRGYEAATLGEPAGEPYDIASHQAGQPTPVPDVNTLPIPGKSRLMGRSATEKLLPGAGLPENYFWTLGLDEDFLLIDYALYSVSLEGGENFTIPEEQLEWHTLSVAEAEKLDETVIAR